MIPTIRPKNTTSIQSGRVRGVRDIEEVSGAGAVSPGPSDGGGAADRDGAAELVGPRAVVGQELEELIAEVGGGRGGAQD